MTTPLAADVHIVSPLTNLAIAYMQDASKFQANLLAPLVPVSKQSDSYFIYDKAAWNRDDFKRREPGAAYPRAGFKMSNTNYTCVGYGLEYPLPDEIRKNFDSPLNADRSAVGHLMNKGLIRRERLFASSFMVGLTWGQDVTGGASASSTQVVYWDNPNATILTDIRNWCDNREQATGFRPNRLVINPAVETVMVNDPDIIDRWKATNSGPISLDAIAGLAGLGSPGDPGKIVSIHAAYNSAAENVTHSGSWMFGDVALLMYVAPSPQIDAPSACYTFSWSEFDQIRGVGAANVTTYREEQTKSDIYRGDLFVDMKVTGSDLGVYFTDLLT